MSLLDELVENDSSSIYKVADDPLEFLKNNWSVKGKIDRMKYSLDGHWYQEGILKDTANEIVVMKSGQMGISEIMLGLATHFAITKGNVVYLFPTSTHIGEFVQGRFNPVIDYSDFLASIVGKGEISNLDTKKGRKKDAADKVSIKKIGNHFMYLRGSQNARQLKSVDGDLLVLDEYDEMIQDNIPLAKSRIDHSYYKWIRALSTPTYPEYGIHSAFLAGDQRYYFLKCDHCGEWQPLTWEENINPEISLEHRLCKKCRRPIDHTQRGEWVPTFRDRDVHSYHISQLYSSVISVKFLVDFQKNPKNEEEFYKSKLGLPYTPKGGSLTRDEIFACMGDYSTLYSPDGVCTMGVDVGRKLHFRISSFFGNKKKVLRADTVDEFEELDVLMKKYDVAVCVIDANPEYKKARDFALRFRGRVYLAYYPNMKESDYYVIGEGKHGELSVNINRTLSLDYTFDRFRSREIILPRDIRDDGREGFIEQVMAPCKVKQFDKKGNQFYTYLEGAKADHFAHASNYDEVASAILGNKEHKKYSVSEDFKGGKVMSKLKEIFDKF